MNKRIHKKLQEVLALLSTAFGRPRWKCWGRALDVLVETILSQNTSNANSSAGYRQLRRRFRTWNAVADAPTGEVEECIRVSGLSRIKAPRIQKILRQIADPGWHGDVVCRHAMWHPQVRLGVSGIARATKTPPRRLGGATLEFLRDLDVEQADRYLQSFEGVGPKTAACVLLFSFHMPIFPVDTHIHRIAIRLGLVPAKSSAADVQRLLTPMIAPRDRYAMHILLIAHGRKTCRAQSPKCEWCDLRQICPFGREGMLAVRKLAGQNRVYRRRPR
jgi:endonuclease-3